MRQEIHNMKFELLSLFSVYKFNDFIQLKKKFQCHVSPKDAYLTGIFVPVTTFPCKIRYQVKNL